MNESNEFSYLFKYNDIFKKHIFDRTRDHEILMWYNLGFSPSAISKIVGSSVSPITKSLNKTIGYKWNPIKYYVNFDYLKLDNDFKLYLIGWILADGWLSIRNKKGSEMSIVVHSKDSHILNFIKDKLSPDRPIYFSKRDQCVRITFPIYNKIIKLLNSYGVVERKSLILKPTEKLIDLSNKDFLQLLTGFIEGDGSVMVKYPKSTNGVRYRMKQVSITSTYEFLLWISQRVSSILNVWVAEPKKKENIAEWRISGRKAEKLIKMCKATKYHLLTRKWNRE